jgi:hypothetical protein
MVLGFQLTKIPSNSCAVGAARKVSEGVVGPVAPGDGSVAGLTWGVAGKALVAGLVAVKEDPLAGWVLVGDGLEKMPPLLVVVSLLGAAVGVLVPP